MEELDRLIQSGNELRGTTIGAPKFKIWANDVRAAVKPYGESMMKILEDALRAGVVIMGGPNYNDNKIDEVVELLENLKERTPEDSRAQDSLINQKQAEARATLQSKFGTITVKGDATFGDGSPITKVTVGEFMAGLVKEVEALPDSEDKNKILGSLKAALANPTFATMSGTVLAEILRKLMGH